MKANIVNEASDYKWSSYKEYITSKGITNMQFVLNIFGTTKKKAIDHFIDFHNEENSDKCLKLNKKIWKITDEEVLDIIINHCINIKKCQRNYEIKISKN